MGKEIKYIKTFFICIVVSATILMGTSLIWNIKKEHSTAYELAKVQALGNFNKDVSFRRWASMHGGLYVPVTDTNPPNPHLKFVPDQNVTTTNGKKLTLINPAFMTRLVFQIEENAYGEKGHITSLKPIRPENIADEWEKKALQLFEKGEQEYSSIEIIDNKEYLRFMKPMRTEKSCLKCHENQGYQLGDIRGGISVAISMDKYRPITNAKINGLMFSHTIIYILIVFFSSIAYRRLIIEMKIKNQNQELLIASEIKLKQQNTELSVAKEKAVESDRLKSVFLQNMSHEIRTPMNAIMGFSNILIHDCKEDTKCKEYANIIMKKSNDLLILINDLIAISKIESEQIVLQLGSTTLQELLSELTPILLNEQRRQNKQNIQLILPNIQSTPNLNLYTDKDKLKRIITKLIGNAFKFTNKGNVKLELNINQTNEITFYVSDTGIGIPQSHHKKIFERFTQMELDSKRLYGGTGIGLAIVKGLVNSLGGEIKLESKPEKGSIFYFSIPTNGNQSDNLSLKTEESTLASRS